MHTKADSLIHLVVLNYVLNFALVEILKWALLDLLRGFGYFEVL